MDIESRRDLELLHAVEQNSQVTQRRLSTKLGIALGLTNIYVKRLVRKGYIKCVTIPPNRLVYLITPRGFARKARLTCGFMQYSLRLVRDARRQLRQSLEANVGGGRRLIAFYGTGEAAELAYLSLKELGLELVAVFDSDSKRQFLGIPVRPIKDQHLIEYDLLIVTSLDQSGAIVKRLVKEGVSREKILTLDSPHSRSAQQNGSGHTSAHGQS